MPHFAGVTIRTGIPGVDDNLTILVYHASLVVAPEGEIGWNGRNGRITETNRAAGRSTVYRDRDGRRNYGIEGVTSRYGSLRNELVIYRVESSA